MSLFDRFKRRSKSKQGKQPAPTFATGSGSASEQGTSPETVPLTVRDVVHQISHHALVPSGDDTTIVDGFKAAAIVEKNVFLAKEAYEQLFHELQTQSQTLETAAYIVWYLTLGALAGGLANVTGDDSYVYRMEQLNRR